MTKGAFIGLGMAAFLGLFAVGWKVFRPRIERDLAQRTRTALQQQAVAVKSTRFSGRDGWVRIQGEPDDARRAAEVVRKVYGVREAQIEAEPVQKLLPRVRVSRIGENLLLEGMVGSQAARDSFSEAAGALFPGVTVRDSLLVRNDTKDAAYVPGVAKMVALLASTAPEGHLELDGTSLRWVGEIASVGKREELEKRAREMLPEGLELTVVLTAPAVEPMPQVVVAAVATRDFRRELESTRLHFVFDSVKLTEDTTYQVEPLVELVKQMPGAKLRVLGHADATGTDAYNQRLSLRRSQAIARMLEAAGIASDAIEKEGLGESRPVADNRTREGRAKNRRVEFEVVGGK